MNGLYLAVIQMAVAVAEKAFQNSYCNNRLPYRQTNAVQ
jgi:hypothetical protein